ncbi:LCP family protein [Actinomycetes bacterium KLBMP 9759]
MSTSKRRRGLRVAGRTAVALASAATLFATGFGWTLQQRIDNTRVTSDAVTGSRPVRLGEAFTALLVGLDARTDAAGNPLPQATLDAMHAGPDEGQLHTDTIILLHVPAEPGAAAVAVSIPRDSFVEIAGSNEKHKINSAYRRGMQDVERALSAQGFSGADLERRAREGGRRTLVATVEALTGESIDHFAEINLAGFLELTDSLGGVPVCLNAPARDSYSGLDLPAGEQTVRGASALAFVRQRHGLEGGDLDRIARQQAFAAGLAQRLRSTGVLTDPSRLAGLVDLATRFVVLDRGWDLDEAVTQFSRLAVDELSFRTIPTGRPDLDTPYDGVAVEIDTDAVKDFVQSVVRGTPVAGATTSAAPTTPTPPTAAPATSAPPATAGPTTTAERVITAAGVPCVD